MIKLAKVQLPNGLVKYAEYQSVTETVCSELFDDDDLTKPFSLEGIDGVGSVCVERNNEQWPVYISSQGLWPASSEGEDEITDYYEGVEADDGMFHLRRLGGQGMTLCAKELEVIKSKVIFSDDQSYDPRFEEYTLMSGSILEHIQSGKVCKKCFLATEKQRNS